MGRPKGVRNRPGSMKPGIKPHLTVIPNFKASEVLKFKKVILELLEAGEVQNLSQAALYLGLPRLAPYSWKITDPEWARRVQQTDQLRADELEEKLDKLNNVVGYIFRLKKLRPEYRDTFKLDIHNEALETLLKELKEVGAPSKVIEVEPAQIESHTSLVQLEAGNINKEE